MRCTFGIHPSRPAIQGGAAGQSANVTAPAKLTATIVAAKR